MTSDGPMGITKTPAKGRKLDVGGDQIFDDDTEDAREDEVETPESSETMYETEDTLENDLQPDELRELVDDGCESEDTLLNENETKKERELRELIEKYRQDAMDRPEEERLYRHYHDTRENPTVLTAEDIMAGGLYVDLVSGEPLSVAICCTPPDLLPHLNEEEKRAVFEEHRREMDAAGQMSLPIEDDANL